MERTSSCQVIDFHVHYVKKEYLNPTWLDYLASVNPSFFERADEYSSDPLLFTNYLRAQGIEYAVVLPEVCPATSGNVPTEDVVNFCKGQKMLLPFASINPNLEHDMVFRLEFYVKELGVKGLKLHPSYQFFYPNEARLYPLYKKAEELKIPIIFHIGSSIFKGTRLKYSDPIYLDDLAVDFPDLKIVMAHSGRGFWYEKSFFLSRLHKNLFMDITGLPPKNLLKYFPDLEKNSEKILFGSDWPTIPVEIKDNVEAILSLPLKDETIEAILYKNAKKILFD